MLSAVTSANISACNPNLETLTFDNTYNPTAPYKSFYNGVIGGFQIALYKPEGDTPIESIIIFESEYNKFKDKLQNFFVKTDTQSKQGEGSIAKLKFTYHKEQFAYSDGSTREEFVLNELQDIVGTRTN